MVEALLAGSSYLEKEHLFIGLFSLEKVLSLKDLKQNSQAARQLLNEKDALDFALLHSGLDSTVLRRRLRRTLPQDGVIRREMIVHRSADCRGYFNRAETLAHRREVTCIHMLNAIMENPGPKILGVVEGSAGQEAHPRNNFVSMQMIRAVQQIQKARENREQLASDIHNSQNTLTSLPRESEKYQQLKKNLSKKIIQLALLCLDYNDIPCLIPALLDLAKESVAGHQEELSNLIAQLDYMQRECLALGTVSVKLVREMIQGMETELRGGAKK